MLVLQHCREQLAMGAQPAQALDRVFQPAAGPPWPWLALCRAAPTVAACGRPRRSGPRLPMMGGSAGQVRSGSSTWTPNEDRRSHRRASDPSVARVALARVDTSPCSSKQLPVVLWTRFIGDTLSFKSPATLVMPAHARYMVTKPQPRETTPGRQPAVSGPSTGKV